MLAQIPAERLIDASVELDFTLELLDQLRIRVCLNFIVNFDV